MPSRSFVLAALGLLAIAPACSRNEISPETLVPPQPVSSATTPPSPTAPPPKVEEGPLPAPVPFEVAKAENDAPPIGKACSTGSQCGSKARVSVRAYFQGYGPQRPTIPCKLANLSPPGQPKMEMDEPSACLDGGRLYVESRCIMCRIDRRTSVEAEIAELTPQQLSNLQKLVTYTGEPLRTASAWQVALAELPKKPRSVPN